MTHTTPPVDAEPGRRWPRPAALALLALLLAGCAAAPPEPEPAVDVRAEQIAEAQRQIDQGRPLAAVRIYRELARSDDPAERQRWRLRIVELLFDEGYPELALQYHRQLDTEPVPPDLETRKRVVDAHAAVAQRQGVRALRLLPEPGPQLPRAVRARALEAQADAYALTGQPVRALEIRIRRDALIAERDTVRRNDERIWDLLQGIPMQRLETLRDRESVLSGWSELALTVRRARLGEQPVTAAIAEWQRRFPSHPAVDRFVPTLRDRIVAELTYPETIAVLLPLSGRYAAPARAVRDGILTAYYNQPPYIVRPQLMIIDTGEDGQSALAAYQRAVDAGAGFVIGPLDKPSVEDLASREDLPVRILTLNYLPGEQASPNGKLVQFGLLPEDEARQAAEAAIQNNHFNGVALVPAGQWGTRMLDAFQRRFEELGGVVLESARYNSQASDHGRQIRALLDLDMSYLRRQRIQRVIGERVRFEPRRRQDVEMVFVAANPPQARLIEPQLEFHRAAELPVYATSHVFTGVPDPKADWDMNGLFFNEIPWILDNLERPGDLYRQVVQHWPDRHERFPRLYALGIDSLSLLPHLERMTIDATAGFNGRTGRLRLDERGRIHRQLQWALFEEGRPRPVPHPEFDEIGDEAVGEDVRERTNGP